MDDSAKLDACQQYLRRKYYKAGAYDLVALRQLADAAFAEANNQVTITATASEAGGSGQGTITFDKWLLISALEDLFLEIDPTNTPAPPPSGTLPDHSRRYVSI